jgi:adenosylmethionine-8-amino-7-oxononanoate aminotransferase
MQQLDFVMFSGFTHGPAIELSEKLMGILPKNQAKIFFNDNGSTAVEAAIKMALQYYYNKEEKRDTLFMAILLALCRPQDYPPIMVLLKIFY